MEIDSKNEKQQLTKDQNDGESESRKMGDIISYDSFIFESNGIRCSSIDFNRVNRFLIGCELGIILPCSIFLWVIFLLFS